MQQSANQSGTQTFEDGDDSIYKTHILYILPSDKNSQDVERVLNNHPLEPYTWIQDVTKLQRPLPTWLQGVPTLLCKQESQIHMGRNIHTYLHSVTSGNGLEEGAVLLPASGELSTSYGQFGGSLGASVETPGTFSLEYDKTPDEIASVPVNSWGQPGRNHMGAAYTSREVFNDETDPSATSGPGNMVAASAGRMPVQPPDSRNANTGGVRNRRRQDAQLEHATRLQALQESRNAQDRRLNPNPHYQR